MPSFIVQHISMIVSNKDVGKEAKDKNEPIDWYYEVAYWFKHGYHYVLILQSEEIFKMNTILKWCRRDIIKYVGKILVKPGVLKLDNMLIKDFRGLEEVIMSDMLKQMEMNALLIVQY